MNTTDEVQKAVDSLKSRPTVAEARRAYNQLLSDLRDELKADADLGPWEEFSPAETAGCAEFGEIGTIPAETIISPVWGVRGPITERQWDDAIDVIKRLANKGFTKMEIIKDEPGQKAIAVQGPEGSILNVGQQRNFTLFLASGCHLTEEGMRSAIAG